MKFSFSFDFGLSAVGVCYGINNYLSYICESRLSSSYKLKTTNYSLKYSAILYATKLVKDSPAA